MNLVRKTINFYKENKAVFAKIYALFLIASVILSFITQKLSAKITESFIPAAQEMTESLSFGNFFSESLISSMKNDLPLLLAAAVIFSLAKFIYKCVIIVKVAETDGNRYEKPRIPSLLAMLTTMVLCELMCGFGFLLFVIPGFILTFFLLMVPCVLVMESKANFVSFDRSFSIVKKNAADLFSAVLVIGAVYFGVQLGFSLILGLIQMITNVIINILPFKISASVTSGIFMFLDSLVSSALYATFLLLLQIALYIQYTTHVAVAETVSQSEFEEKKYTLDDYYRGKEEPDDDDDNDG